MGIAISIRFFYFLNDIGAAMKLFYPFVETQKVAQTEYDQSKERSHGSIFSPEKSSKPRWIDSILKRCDIHLDGASPVDIKINNSGVYKKVMQRWSLGLGESYMDGDWDCEQLDEAFNRLLRFDIDQLALSVTLTRSGWDIARAKLFNLQSKHRARIVGTVHYDIGNDLFEKMLDPHMIYSCGYWETAKDLAEAQEHKLKMICEKLDLRPGEKLLEIGCGWGGLAAYAASHYNVEVLGITISQEQQRLAQARCAGLPVQIDLMDYRDLTGQFDKIVSVGMFEHVGDRNYRTYFEHAYQLLKDEGLFLLHSIGSNITTHTTDPWINRYIFPNGKIPSPIEITKNIDRLFLIEDWHNFGQDYDKTLMAWYANFEKSWPSLSSNYDQKFYRMWTYYLLSSAGYFRSRQGQLWQIVLSKRNKRSIYRSSRMKQFN